jgi:hypothetical protein
MAIPILNHMDFGKAAEIQNVLLHTTGQDDVTSPGTGQIIYDGGTVKVYSGSAWLSLASGGGRTVQLDTNGDGSVNNTLETSENLVLKKGSNITLAESGGVVTISSTDTDNDTQLSEEQVEDFVGGMVTGNTETGITVTYQDSDGTLDFVIGAGDIVHSMLADDAVDVDNLASDAVVTASILDANVTTAKIADDNVTYAKIQNVAANNVLLGNDDGAGSGIQELTKANVLSLLNVADGAQVNVGTDLSQTTAAAQLTIESSTGDNIVVAEATGSIAGLMSTTHHDKLDGIAAGAQVNVSGDSGNAAIYDNSGTPAFKSGITKAEVQTLLNVSDGAGNTGASMTEGTLRTKLAAITEAVTIGDATDVVVTTSGNLVVTGDLTVSGDTITASVGTLDVEDKNITLNKSTGDSSSTADGAGITIQDAVDASNDATILWDATNDEFDFSHKITVPSVAGNLILDGNTISGIDDSTEFTNDDNHIMTSAAIEDKILGYGYTTDAGVTHRPITAGGNTLANGETLAFTAGSNVTISESGGAVTIASTDTTTNTQLATAAALIDVSAMASNSVASFTHSLGTKNLIVQMHDTTSGLIVHADVDHTSNNAIAITFAQTGAELVTAGIGDIRVVVIDAVNGVTDKTVSYS